MTQAPLAVRPLTAAEREMLPGLLTRDWGSPEIVSRGRIHDASRCPALGCFEEERLVGLATYELNGAGCEPPDPAVHPGAAEEARRLKPVIPEFGAGGVRISDELEFELDLEG